jgi:hypothetical protein
MAAQIIGFLKRSRKKRVSSATSRDGGGAVGINVVEWDQFKNRVSVVLCHAKVCRASSGNNHSVSCHSERSEESQFIICGEARGAQRRHQLHQKIS